MSAPSKGRESIPVIETGGSTPPPGKSKALPILLLLIAVAVVAVILWSVLPKNEGAMQSAQTAAHNNGASPDSASESGNEPEVAGSSENAAMSSGPATTLAAPMMERSGAHLAGVRSAFESAGWRVDWLSDSRSAVLTKGDSRIEISPGNETVTAGSATITSVPAPLLENGRMYLPVTAIQDATEGHVVYDEASKTLTSK